MDSLSPANGEGQEYERSNNRFSVVHFQACSISQTQLTWPHLAPREAGSDGLPECPGRRENKFGGQMAVTDINFMWSSIMVGIFNVLQRLIC
jgi:hypothetical protein